MPSTISAKLYCNLQAKAIQYIDSSNEKSKKTIESKDIEKERWSRGRKRKKSCQSYYYNNHDLLEIGKLKSVSKDLSKSECDLFERTYSMISSGTESDNRKFF